MRLRLRLWWAMCGGVGVWVYLVGHNKYGYRIKGIYQLFINILPINSQ